MSDEIWVKSEPSLDGKTYVVTLEVDDDTAVALDRERATAYALGVLDAAHRAAYDAAVFRQLTATLRLDEPTAGQMLVDLRADRPAPDHWATTPLVLVPGVSAFTGKPFVAIEVKGKRVGQWSVEDTRQHALHVLESLVVADLDAGYHRALVGSVGIETWRARNVVADIANHRDDGR